MTESSYRCNIIIQFLKLSEVSCCSLQSIKLNSQRFIHTVTQIPAKKRITSTYYYTFYLENIAFGEACGFLSLTAICNIERLQQISFELFANFNFHPLLQYYPIAIDARFNCYPGYWLFFLFFWIIPRQSPAPRLYMWPHVRESKTVMDSGFHAVDSGFRLLDSRPFSGLGFQIPVVSEMPDSYSCIPDRKAQDSGFHKQKISKTPDTAGKNCPDSFTWGKYICPCNLFGMCILIPLAMLHFEYCCGLSMII